MCSHKLVKIDGVCSYSDGVLSGLGGGVWISSIGLGGSLHFLGSVHWVGADSSTSVVVESVLFVGHLPPVDEGETNEDTNNLGDDGANGGSDSEQVGKETEEEVSNGDGDVHGEDLINLPFESSNEGLSVRVIVGITLLVVSVENREEFEIAEDGCKVSKSDANEENDSSNSPSSTDVIEGTDDVKDTTDHSEESKDHEDDRGDVDWNAEAAFSSVVFSHIAGKCFKNSKK